MNKRDAKKLASEVNQGRKDLIEYLRNYAKRYDLHGAIEKVYGTWEANQVVRKLRDYPADLSTARLEKIVSAL